MNEDLREKAEAEVKVNQLQVNRRFQWILRLVFGRHSNSSDVKF